MLYPVENKVREVKNLSGIWNFKMDYDNIGIQEQWQKEPLKDTIPMAVPSSYNDLFTEEREKEHVGYVWYEKSFGMEKELFYVSEVQPIMQQYG